MSGSVAVHGGPGGIEADIEAMTATATRLGEVGLDCLGRAGAAHGILFDPVLVPAALLDPAGGARFEFELGYALDGPGGLAATAARLGLLDVDLRSAAAAYRAADRIADLATPYLRAIANLPETARELSRGHWQRALLDNPDLVSVVRDLVQGSPTLAGLLAVYTASSLLADGKPQVLGTGTDRDDDDLGPPRSVADLITGLARRSGGGDVDVRFVAPPDGGARKVIVDIPGTDSWDPDPTMPDVTNLSTNVLSIQGATTTYERGVIEAMRQAGVTSTDDVLLVGHSQGGMIAVTTARDLDASGEFRVSHVLTAGAPIATSVASLPRNVSVLAIENTADIVPALDGAANPDRPNVTTVSAHEQRGTVGANHGLLTAYAPIAAQIDANVGNNPSISAYMNSLRGFLDAEQITTHAFHISRTS